MIRLVAAGRRFGRHTVFAGLDLHVPTGTRLFLAGSNGSGKTTLLRVLAGTLRLTTGRATIDGHRAGSLAARRRIGLCLAPEQGLYARMSGRDNLALAARLRLAGPAAAPAVAHLIEEFEIAAFATTPAGSCSSGMRARISIARALLGDPPVLLLDEPTRSLDERGRALLWAALDRRPHLACVIAAHGADDRARCDRLLTLPVGR